MAERFENTILNEVFVVLRTTGIPQSVFWQSLSYNSRQGSRIIRTLLRDDKITREPILFEGRMTYKIKLVTDISFKEFTEYCTKKSNAPHLDFKAPELTPRIKEAVELRLKGHKISDIAEFMGISPQAVSLYLRAARHPETYHRGGRYRGQEIKQDSLILIESKLKEKGFVLPKDFAKSLSADFNKIARHIFAQGRAQVVSFPSQRKFWGSLAGTTLLYIDGAKVAKYVSNVITNECLPNFSNYSRRGGGHYKSVSTYLRRIGYGLGDIFRSDKQTLEICRERLSRTSLS